MKIKIKSIDLSYFKGVRRLHVSSDNDVVSIYGANGTGKTTVADAIQWCLFGKNALGETKFGIKTLDDNGKVIPNVEHSVTLSLDIDGKDVDIKRVWVEDKVLNRGRETDEVKHHAEFYVNGEKFLKKDFDAYMENLVDEQTFRAVTSPTYFFSLKWQEQREMLRQMAGDIDYSGINAREEYKDVLEKIAEHENLEGYLKHLGYNIKQIREKLKQIPSRIDEQRQTMPEAYDWVSIMEDKESLSKSMSEKKSMLEGMKNGSMSSAAKLLRQRIEFCHKRIDNMVTSARNMSTIESRRHNDELQEMRKQYSTASKELDALKNKQESLKMYISRCDEALKVRTEEEERFRGEWKAMMMMKPTLAQSGTCPVCGQTYSAESLSLINDRIVKDFNEKRAIRKEELTKRAEDLKVLRLRAESEKGSYEKSLAEIDLRDITETVEQKRAMLEELESKNLPTAEDLLNANTSYRQALTEMHELEMQLDGEVETDNSEVIANLEKDIQELQLQYEEKARMLGTKDVYEAHLQRIEELEKEQTSLIEQLDKMEMSEDLAHEYEQDCNELLEETVNELFSVVRFRLFETLNDGTKKPNCVAWVKTSTGLVPLQDANAAMTLNAGRDVLTTISKYYDVYAPCVTDNAESTLNLLPIPCQDFRLFVSEDEMLKVM